MKYMEFCFKKIEYARFCSVDFFSILSSRSNYFDRHLTVTFFVLGQDVLLLMFVFSFCKNRHCFHGQSLT